jgi:hypothetical protein
MKENISSKLDSWRGKVTAVTPMMLDAKVQANYESSSPSKLLLRHIAKIGEPTLSDGFGNSIVL